MNKRRKYKWKLLVFVNCCCYFKQSFRICSAMHCDVLLLGYISNIYVWSEPPECTDILRYILSCRASAIYGQPINLRYIWKRCSPLMSTDWGHIKFQIFSQFSVVGSTTKKTESVAVMTLKCSAGSSGSRQKQRKRKKGLWNVTPLLVGPEILTSLLLPPCLFLEY